VHSAFETFGQTWLTDDGPQATMSCRCVGYAVAISGSVIMHRRSAPIYGRKVLSRELRPPAPTPTWFTARASNLQHVMGSGRFCGSERRAPTLTTLFKEGDADHEGDGPGSGQWGPGAIAAYNSARAELQVPEATNEDGCLTLTGSARDAQRNSSTRRISPT
jgi:hypothetical protein